MKVNELFKSIPNSTREDKVACWKRMQEGLNHLTLQQTLDKSKDAGSPLEVQINTLQWVVDMPFKDKYGIDWSYTGTVNDQKDPHGFGRAIDVDDGHIIEG